MFKGIMGTSDFEPNIIFIKAGKAREKEGGCIMKKRLMASVVAASMAMTMFGAMPAAATEGTDTVDYSDVWAEAWADVDISEHVVINYMVTGDKPTNDYTDQMLEELNAILTEKVNAELQIYYIGWTDYLSNYNLTLARMDGSVDLVGTATDWLDAWPNAKNGAFLELSEEMLAKYCPVTYEEVGEEHWELCKYNGEIYLIPEDQYAQWTNHGFAYRQDWAELAGLEDGVHSWEDMTTYFQYVCEHKDELGYVTAWDSDGTQYATMAGGWVSSHTDFISIDGLTAQAFWGGTKDDPYTIICPLYTDTDLLVEFAELMKEWNDMGVWKTDVLNNTSADNREDFKVGNTAAEQHHTQTWTGLLTSTTATDENGEEYNPEVGFFWFGEETGNLVALNITHGAMAVSYASENPERALMVYDLLRNDPECYYLLCYGQQGVQWDLNEDGLRIEAEGYDSSTMAITTNWWWGRNDNIEIKDATLDWDTIEALYAVYDEVAIDYLYGQFIPDVDSIQSYINNIEEVNTTYMKQIAYGKYTGTAEEIVAEYQQALKNAGMDIVIEELQRQIDELYGTAE